MPNFDNFNLRKRWSLASYVCGIALLMFMYAYNALPLSLWLNKQLNAQSLPYFDTQTIDLFDNGFKNTTLEIIDQKHAYIDVHLNFELSNNKVDEYFDLFKSSNSSDALRLYANSQNEIILQLGWQPPGTDNQVVIADKKRVSNGIHYLQLTASNRHFIKVFIDGHFAYQIGSKKIDFKTDAINLGDWRNANNHKRVAITKAIMEYGTHKSPTLARFILDTVFICFLSVLIIFVPKIIKLPVVFINYNLKLFVLSFPAACLILYIEGYLSQINSNYLNKRLALEDNRKEASVLVVGSSNTVYGIDPKYFPVPGVNLAFLGNDMFHDAAIVREHQPKMPNLTDVIFTVNYFTLGLDYQNFSQNWRSYFLKQFLGTETNYDEDKSNRLHTLTNSKNFSKIFLLGKTIYSTLYLGHTLPLDISSTRYGWHNSGYVLPTLKSIKLGKAGALAHNASTNAGLYQRNYNYIEKEIIRLKKSGVKSHLVVLPVHDDYGSTLSTEHLKQMNLLAENIAIRQGINFHDYTFDDRFNLNDFHFAMIDHLNASGAKKFSQILSKEIFN